MYQMLVLHFRNNLLYKEHLTSSWIYCPLPLPSEQKQKTKTLNKATVQFTTGPKTVARLLTRKSYLEEIFDLIKKQASQ